MQIEKDFLEAMEKVHPGVEKDSLQFKSSRLMFYMGAFTLTTSKSEITLINEVREALKFVSELAEQGLQPEESLADYLEHVEKDL